MTYSENARPLCLDNNFHVQNSALMRQSKGMHTDEVDDDRVQTQLVTTKLELAETLGTSSNFLQKKMKYRKGCAI